MTVNDSQSQGVNTTSPEKVPEPVQPSDEELALSFRGGDIAAFEALVRRHQGRVYAVAYRLTGNREDALDVTQDALMKVHRKIGSWKPTGSFAAWLMRLTANQAIDHMRRRKRRRYEPLDDSAADPAADVEAGARRSEIDGRVQEALQVLSPSQRTAFVLRHYEGLALAEIAPILGCSVGSVKVHVFRALRKLRVELKDLAP